MSSSLFRCGNESVKETNGQIWARFVLVACQDSVPVLLDQTMEDDFGGHSLVSEVVLNSPRREGVVEWSEVVWLALGRE